MSTTLWFLVQQKDCFFRLCSEGGSEEGFFSQVLHAINMLQTNPVSVSHSLTAAGLLGSIIREGPSACQVGAMLSFLELQRALKPLPQIGIKNKFS